MEAYRIGIAIGLHGNASSFLRAFVGELRLADAEAKKLKETLRNIKLLGLAGAGLGLAGFAGLDLLKDTLKPAREYNRELALMNQNVRNQAEAAKMVTAAWQTSRDVLTTTPTMNLQAAQELRQVFGAGPTGLAELTKALPIVQKMDAILGSFTGKFGEKGSAYTIAKALEMVNATHDSAEFVRQADMMIKAVEASRARVTPEDFHMAFKYGRTATTGWDDRFKYQILPTLIQEMKTRGGSGGTGGGPGNPLMSAFSEIVGGNIFGQHTLGTWADLGLLDMRKAVFTRRTHELKGILPGGVKGWEIFEHDPFEWVTKVLRPALRAKELSSDQVRQTLSYLFPSRTAGFIMSQMDLVPWKFTRDFPLYTQAKGLSGYRQLMKENPDLAFQSAEAQWTKLKIVIGNELIPIVIPAMQKLADVLDDLATWGRANPNLLRNVIVGFGLLSGALAISGTILTTVAALKALKLVMTGWPKSSPNIPGGVPPAGGVASLWARAGIAAAAIEFGTSSGFGQFLPMSKDDQTMQLWRSMAARRDDADWRVRLVRWMKSGDSREVAKATGDGAKAGIQAAAPDLAEKVGAAVGRAVSGLSINIDGKKVAEAVARHIDRAASRSPIDRDGVDTRQIAPSAGSGAYYTP